MRKERDGESTREAVIAAARVVFAERGFSGTSLAMISERSGVSVGLILHHFKNKENLYHAILSDLAAQYAQVIAEAGTKSRDPEQITQDVLRATFKFWSEDSVYNRMSLWAFLENQPQWVEDEVNLTRSLAAVIQQMQAQGKVDSGLSPFVLLSMTIGPIHFWTRSREVFKAALHLDDTTEALDATFLEQYIDLIQKIYQTG